jgi:hypothetical protein
MINEGSGGDTEDDISLLFLFLNKWPQVLVIVWSIADVLRNHELFLGSRARKNQKYKGCTAQQE